MRRIAQDVYDQNSTSDQFAVAQTSYHVHNGTDSQNIPYMNIVKKIIVLPYTIPGTNSATGANYSTFFIAPYPMTIIGITEVHAVKGTDAGAVTLQVEKLINTTAPGSGLGLLTTPFDLKGTINTVKNGVLTPNVGITRLNVGDRLALLASGTLTDVANVTVVVTFQF